MQTRGPEWLEAARGEGVAVSGRVLGELGLPLPVLAVGQAVLLHLVEAPPG